MPEPPADVRVFVDDAGRRHHYVARANAASDSLVVHFSAFFGEWGNARPYRHIYKGYFHRLRMLGDVGEHNWLFLCDEYGADRNGTYYTGEAGDHFVERAALAIVDLVADELGIAAERTVTIGSSMGATGALAVGLQRDVKGIVAIVPHVDLDIAAAKCGRERHVAAICPNGDWKSEGNREHTRRVGALLEARDPARPLPRLFVQSCADDAGVHVDQVLPLVERWRSRGGWVDVDVRERGGHTSDWATKALLLDVARRVLDEDVIEPSRYAQPPYLGHLTRTPLSHRLRRTASLAHRRALGMLPRDRAAGPERSVSAR